MNKSQMLPPKMLPTFLLTALLLVLFSAGANGQRHQDRSEAELRQTDRLLEDALSMLSETSNAKAEELINQARNLQQRAWEALHQGQGNFALRLTERARDLIAKSLGLLHRRQENESFVDRELERTDSFLDRAREHVSTGDEGSALLMYEQALRLQDRARDMFSERNLKQALNLTLRARKLLRETFGDLANEKRRQEQVLQRLEEVQQRMERHRGLIVESKDDAALSLLNGAARQLNQAREAAAERHWQRTILHLGDAVSQLNKALRRVQGSGEPEDAGRALSLADRRYARLIDKANESGSNDAEELLAEIAEKLEKAHSLFEQGEYDRVLVVVRVVMELEQQAQKILGEW